MTTLFCMPPDGTPDQSWHWLLSPHDRLIVAFFTCSQWRLAGIHGDHFSSELARRGFQYSCPVQPPKSSSLQQDNLRAQDRIAKAIQSKSPRMGRVGRYTKSVPR